MSKPLLLLAAAISPAACEIMLIEPGDGVAAGLAEIEKAYVDFVYALAEAE